MYKTQCHTVLKDSQSQAGVWKPNYPTRDRSQAWLLAARLAAVTKFFFDCGASLAKKWTIDVFDQGENEGVPEVPVS